MTGAGRSAAGPGGPRGGSGYRGRVAKRPPQSSPAGGRRGPARPRTRRGSIERLQQRVGDALANVDAAMSAAVAGAPSVRQLDQAAADWRIEADRIRHELEVTQRLTGDPRQQAMDILRGRVDTLVAVADRIVEQAFTETLLPRSPVVDRLQHASDQLDALEQAHRELDDLTLDRRVRRTTVRLVRLRTLPGFLRR